jgi:hypothetical protein
VTRDSAVKARSAALNQLENLIITAPDEHPQLSACADPDCRELREERHSVYGPDSGGSRLRRESRRSAELSGRAASMPMMRT